MPLHSFYLLQVKLTQAMPTITDSNNWSSALVSIAPLMQLLVALSNLMLVIIVFRFTKRKNNSDRNIKWFQELIYTPNKDLIINYFNNLLDIKNKIPTDAEPNDDLKIELITIVKEERSKIFSGLVDTIKPIASNVHTEISNTIETLTDDLTKAIDNDELKLNNTKTQQRELTTRILIARGKVYNAFFKYQG